MAIMQWRINGNGEMSMAYENQSIMAYQSISILGLYSMLAGSESEKWYSGSSVSGGIGGQPSVFYS
jgi:hypothetical protein